ncbi:MAG: efflux RND transporter permease subunit [Opitutales bacterium]
MIAWFTRNGVAANLVMLIIVVGGLASLVTVKKELFPQFSLGTVVVTVPYLGAAPEEVEQAVVLRVEEAVEGLDGIKEIRSTAREGIGVVRIEAQKNYPIRTLLDDVKSRVDAISTFPEETERPIIEEALVQRDVLWVAVYGQASERSLKELAERIRDDLVKQPGISQAEVQGTRSYEISIAVREETLRRYGLTFEEVVAAVRGYSVDLPGGTIRSDAGEILLRTTEQNYTGEEYAEIVLLTRPDGSRILLRDVAELRDGFVDEPLVTTFNGKPAALVKLQEVGDENPITISDQTDAYLETARETWLPEGIAVDLWGDSSFYLKGRLNMLIENGLIGLLLVMIVLSVFLRPSLAFFVALGIPVSFLGTFFVAPVVGISINLISLFAFILVLGIVVDDAIVVGESVFTAYQRDGVSVDAAIRGSHAVAIPVTYAVLTTAVAFIPVFFLPGLIGKFFKAIPLVVIPTLLFSLVQSKLVLPYHLTLCKVGSGDRSTLNRLQRLQRSVADGLETFVRNSYQPVLDRCLRRRYLTVAGFVAVFLVSIGFVTGGWVRFVQFPKVPSDFIQIDLRMPAGTPFAETSRAMARIDAALAGIREQATADGGLDPVKHVLEFIGAGSTSQGTNRGFMLIELAKSEIRDSNAFEISEQLRSRIGEIPGARELRIEDAAGGPSGSPIDVQLTGRDFETLRAASFAVRDYLKTYEGLFDIRDSYSEGKREVKVTLKPNGESLGISAAQLGSQIRSAFYGAEAQRIQRGRHEVKVMVRYPADRRTSLADLENMRIRLPGGSAVPIAEVADTGIGAGYPAIERVDGQRTINIRADADKQVADVGAINASLYEEKLDDILKAYPGVTPVKAGEARDWEETRGSLLGSALLVACLIYALLAVPFRSYLQPIIVMCVIPFGLCGAIFGHFITFQDLSMLSLLGIIALSGVVVNDSLVLVDFINRERSRDESLIHAVKRAGAVRFRPILLTSLTTFAGLVPILLEQSLQAQFLIPMATSLAFGVIFATVITLILVPCGYLILEDLKGATGWLIAPYRNKASAAGANEQATLPR